MRAIYLHTFVCFSLTPTSQNDQANSIIVVVCSHYIFSRFCANIFLFFSGMSPIKCHVDMLKENPKYFCLFTYFCIFDLILCFFFCIFSIPSQHPTTTHDVRLHPYKIYMKNHHKNKNQFLYKKKSPHKIAHPISPTDGRTQLCKYPYQNINKNML